MKALGLIIQREYSSRVKTKAFILTTILTPLLMIGVIFVPSLLMSIKSDDISKIYVIDRTGLYFNQLETTSAYQFEQIKDSTEMKKGETVALLDISENLNEKPASVVFISEKQQPPKDLINYINDVLNKAVKQKKIEQFSANNQLAPHTVDELQVILKEKDAVQVTTMRLDEDGKATDTLNDIASMVGLAFTFSMFFFIMMYGSMVMQSVVEEKTNRIVEVIISSTKPFNLMMGKIIGIALTGFTQLLVWGILIGIGSLAISSLIGIDTTAMSSMSGGMGGSSSGMAEMLNSTGAATMITAIQSINWIKMFFCFVLYFIGGYLIYSSLFAMFGSAANDAQEAQQFVMPISIILMLAFYAGFAAVHNPEGPMAFWFSIIPFTSPIVMMVRLPYEVPLWEILLSFALLYGTAIVLVQLAAKIYRIGILMYGKKVSFREIMRWFNYK